MELLNQLNYPNLLMGDSGLSVASYGCYSVCLAIIGGLSVEKLVYVFNREEVYNKKGYIQHPNDRDALGFKQYYKTLIDPKCLCIAEVDFSPTPQKDQHFVVWLGDGTIIDPWGGKKMKNPYKVYSYRVYKPLKNIMSNYHCTSDLERANQKIDKNFDGDSKDGQKDFAKKLEDFIDEKEKLEERVEEYEKQSLISNLNEDELNELTKLRELETAVNIMLNFK